MVELYTLLSHLKGCPEVFLEQPVENPVSINTHALVADCFRMVSGDFLLDNNAIPSTKELNDLDGNIIPAIRIGCWLFSHSIFEGKPELLPAIRLFMFQKLPVLAPLVEKMQWLEDEDRTEEFVRLALRCCEILTDRETQIQAEDRLDALDTIKRQKVLKESSGAFERMMEIRRKMAEQKAREAANVYGRE
ncbi:hypothetical protein [Desertivirga arenae]|uniref:hypothetical protein n=1 Tax=Desertivirga arenae TaxID=2810309 RepID=UPI001A966A1F|nr:hypothetical protein [Pedobacter sp. SYSU D00823]